MHHFKCSVSQGVSLAQSEYFLIVRFSLLASFQQFNDYAILQKYCWKSLFIAWMLLNRRLRGKVSTKQYHHAWTKNICKAVALAAKRWSKYECAIQECTRGSPFISSFPGEHKLNLLNELLKIATFLGHVGRPCGHFPILVCWRQCDQAQANYGYESVYFCAPFTQSYWSTASRSWWKAKEGQEMARVGLSCIKAFRYSVESHSSNLKR